MEVVIVILIVVSAVAAVMVPLLRRGGQEPLDRPPPAPPDDDELEREIARYRAALRAGTLCERCGAANPETSRYCADCGRRLKGAAA